MRASVWSCALQVCVSVRLWWAAQEFRYSGYKRRWKKSENTAETKAAQRRSIEIVNKPSDSVQVYVLTHRKKHSNTFVPVCMCECGSVRACMCCLLACAFAGAFNSHALCAHLQHVKEPCVKSERQWKEKPNITEAAIPIEPCSNVWVSLYGYRATITTTATIVISIPCAMQMYWWNF